MQLHDVNLVGEYNIAGEFGYAGYLEFPILNPSFPQVSYTGNQSVIE
jgi:hypothetical protein